MPPPAPSPSNGRAVFLTLLLLTLVTVSLVGFFVMLIGPGFLGVVAVLTVVGLAHYLLWGRAMEKEVDVEEMEEPSAEANGWPSDGPQHPRRF